MKNNKICFITTGNIKYIATAKRAIGMANPLQALGWDVHIIMEDVPENRHRVQLECNSSIHIHYFSSCSAFKEIQKKNAIIKKISPDYVYICAFVFRNIVSVTKRCKKLIEHSELQSKMNKWNISNIRFYVLEYFSILYSDGILNASKYLQNLYASRSKKMRIKKPMLYFPYAYNKDICTHTSKNYIYKKNSEDKYFLYIGSLTSNYGCFTLIKAFEILHQKHYGLKLLLIGKGSAYNDIITYINNNHLNDFIYVPGYIEEEDIPAYFSFVDAFLSPMNNTIQDWARCPSKLYMYLPYKKPIITCRIGEPYETLGENGIYYEPSNVNSLVKTIQSMVVKDIWFLNIDATKHEWTTRANEFHQWINQTFLI